MNARSDIRDVLTMYFDVLYYCDVEIFDQVFHQHAIYATADEGAPVFLGMPEYRQVISDRESPAYRQESRKDFIDSIEFAGNNTARAVVRCSIARKDFVDFLTLIRTDSQWQVIAKVFQVIKN